MLDNLTLADLQIIWFILVGVLFSGYAILDGFDLGTGALQLFIKGDENRRLTLNAVGPVWDGNEVWLITGGGALFAAFPYVYASVFSGFYLAFMLLLLTLIFRAVSIEFRSKQPMKWWRRVLMHESLSYQYWHSFLQRTYNSNYYLSRMAVNESL